MNNDISQFDADVVEAAQQELERKQIKNKLDNPDIYLFGIARNMQIKKDQGVPYKQASGYARTAHPGSDNRPESLKQEYGDLRGPAEGAYSRQAAWERSPHNPDNRLAYKAHRLSEAQLLALSPEQVETLPYKDRIAAYFLRDKHEKLAAKEK